MKPTPSLTPIGDSLWSVDSTQTMPGGWRMPARMTVARLHDGSVLLHSPVPIDDALAVQIARLGPVAHLVAPSRLHHLHQGPALSRYPQARLYAAPGLSAKRPDLPIAEALGDEAPRALRDDFEVAMVHGAPSLSEAAFFHRASRSLVVVDLVFNVRRPEGWLTSLVLLAVGARGRLAQSRAWRFFAQDPPRYRESLRRIFAWPFERLVMAHGDVVLEMARPSLAAALARGPGRVERGAPALLASPR